MPSVDSVGSTAAGSVFVPQSSTDPVSVATALTTLRLKPTATVTISDTIQNIQKNLEALQKVAAKIEGLTTTDDSKKLTVTATQYATDSAILAKWGAEDGNTVEVTGVKAGSAKALVDAKADYVASIRVTDTSLNIQRALDDLQALADDGTLKQIVQSGATSTLRITAAQLAADQDALGMIKNGAYSLAITNASVSDTLGLDGQTALTANSKIKSIDVKDTTAAIEDNLDALQRIGLRLKTISQTDSEEPLTVTGTQYVQDAKALGKIITSYQLAVIKASAAQSNLLSTNDKVVTVSVADTAANISKRWSLMQKLVDGLTTVEVTDSNNAIKITGDQLAQSEELLTKFADDDDHTFKLSVSGVAAGSAKATADLGHVSSISISDSTTNLVSNFDDLKAVDDLGLLSRIALTGKNVMFTMDASRLSGDELTATQSVLSKIASGTYSITATGVDLTDLSDLASNTHIVSMEVGGSSDDIADNLDTLYHLGKKITKIEQSDSGEAIALTQSKFDSRAAVLGKIEGGYSVNLSGVTANKISAAALNSHVAKIAVTDTGKHIASHWNALRTIGETLDSITKTDEGSLSLTVSQYQGGVSDELFGKFDASLKFSVTGASIIEATEISEDDTVDTVDVTDDSTAVTTRLSDLKDLLTAGKLNSITLSTPATSLAFHASELDGAQDVLDLISGGRYSLAVDEVAVGDALGLVTDNTKIASLGVTGDAAGITDNLSDLTAIGHKLQSIVQTDAGEAALELTGSTFEQYKGTLSKISGGYSASLTEVAAAKAASFAENTHVQSLAVSDTGDNLASAWDTFGTLGSKLGDIAQSDSDLIHLTLRQWTAAPGIADKFSTSLAVAISRASISDLSDLSDNDSIQEIRLTDTADNITEALPDLAAASKITNIQVTDPETAISMSGETYADSTDVLALIKSGQYSLSLSDVAAADVATVAADTHVTSLSVTGTAEEISTKFDDLAALTTLSSLSLTGDDTTLSLSADQILSNSETLEKIASSFQIAATDVSMADLADIGALSQISSIGITDTAENVSTDFADIVALGGTLSKLHLTDDTAVLSLTHADWVSGSTALGKIAGSYQVDLSEVSAIDVSTAAADDSVHGIAVSDLSTNIASTWANLVTAYDEGSGKLTSITLTDASPLSLTEEQQTSGAAMIEGLLSDATIVTET